MRRDVVVAAFAAFLSTGCSVTNPYYDPQKPHHTKDGFKNNYLTESIGGSFLRWQYEHFTHSLPPPENHYAFPIVQPDLNWLRNNRTQNSATWIGHATVLMQVNGVNLITDPVFSKRVSPLSFIGPARKVPLPMTITDLPHIDVVLISHNHYDHLDKESVRQLNRQPGGPPLFLVPLGIKRWMANAGIDNVRELDWWQETSVPGLTLHFVPAQHWSSRTFIDRFQSLWGGWMVRTAPIAAFVPTIPIIPIVPIVPIVLIVPVVPIAPIALPASTGNKAPTSSEEKKPFSFFFAGDTGYSKDFADIQRRFDSVDLALLPIGAYAPRWFMRNQHIDPLEAVKIHQDLRARHSMAIHWGTFELTDEALDAPPKVLAQALSEAGIATDQFSVLDHGATLKF